MVIVLWIDHLYRCGSIFILLNLKAMINHCYEITTLSEAWCQHLYDS